MPASEQRSKALIACRCGRCAARGVPGAMVGRPASSPPRTAHRSRSAFGAVLAVDLARALTRRHSGPSSHGANPADARRPPAETLFPAHGAEDCLAGYRATPPRERPEARPNGKARATNRRCRTLHLAPCRRSSTAERDQFSYALDEISLRGGLSVQTTAFIRTGGDTFACF